MAQKDMLTLNDLAELLGLNPHTLYVRRWRHPEDLPPAVIVGRGPRPTFRFRRSDVEAWLDRRTERPKEASLWSATPAEELPDHVLDRQAR